MCVAGLIGKQVSQFLVSGGAIPDEVVAAMAFTKIVVGASDGIAKTLLARRKAKGECVEEFCACAVRESGFVNKPAPRDVARVFRLHFGENVGANRGAKAVSADEEIGFARSAIRKMHCNRIRAYFDALQFPAKMVAVGRKGIAQHAKHAIPGSDDLRALESSDEIAGGVESFAPRNGDAEILRWIEPASLQNGAKLNVRDDARATSGKFETGPLEHIDRPAELAQKQRGEKSGHGAADDDSPL